MNCIVRKKPRASAIAIAVRYSSFLQKKYPVDIKTIREMQDAGTYNFYVNSDWTDGFFTQQAKSNQSNYAKVTKNLVEVIAFTSMNNSGIERKTADEFKSALLDLLGVENLPYEKAEILHRVCERLEGIREKMLPFVEKNNGAQLHEFLGLFAKEISNAAEIGISALDVNANQDEHAVLRSLTAISVATSRLLNSIGFQDIARIFTVERDVLL